jgi:anti-repressor protein
VKDVFCMDARELHGRLGVGRHFADWIKDRIEKHNFVENRDFVLTPNLSVRSASGTPAREYQVTTDMAHDLASAEEGASGPAFGRRGRA